MNTFINVFEQPWSWFTIAAVCCIVVVLAAATYDRRASIKRFLEHRREIRKQRGLLMGKKKRHAREAYLKGRWCDGLTEFGEKEFFEGRQTREEVNAFYRAIGKTHHMPDLVPVMTQAQLKKVVKYRRAHGIPSPAQEHPAWGEATPAPPKVENVINARKRFGEKALSRLKTA